MNVKHRSEIDGPEAFNHSRHIGNATFAKDLRETLKGDLDQGAFAAIRLKLSGKIVAKASVGSRSSRPQWFFALAAVPVAFVDLIATASAVISITLLGSSLSYGAELFPFEPPSTTRERMTEQRSITTPQLSAEDRDKISKLAAQAKQLSSSDQSKLKERLRKSLDSAAKKGDLNQVRYFNEALRQLD